MEQDQATKAYEWAEKEIARVKAEGLAVLDFNKREARALTKLPPEIAGLEGLRTLNLDGTQVSDISAISGMAGLKALFLCGTQVSDISAINEVTGLQRLDLSDTRVSNISGMAGLQALFLSRTQVSDISAISGMTGLRTLDLERTQVRDLRPICKIDSLVQEKSSPFSRGLSFQNTPAVAADTKLARLARVTDDTARTRDTLAYLKTLPEWPLPLDGAMQKPAPYPAPLLVRFEDGMLRKTLLPHGMAGDVLSRAAQGWGALQDYLSDIKDRRARISNAMPQLAQTLDWLATPLQSDTPDVDNAIRFGMQAERFIRLARPAGDLLSDENDAEDIQQFALELGRYVAREPVWNAYKSDNLPSREERRQVALAVPELHKLEGVLKAADWVEGSVAVSYGEIVTDAEEEPDEAIAAKGAIDATRELINEVAAEAVKQASAAKAKGVWKEYTGALRAGSVKAASTGSLAVVGSTATVAVDVLFNNAEIITSLAVKFPDIFGYVMQVLKYIGAVA